MMEDGESNYSATFDLSETFDEVINKYYPIDAPRSSLETRANMTYTKVYG